MRKEKGITLIALVITIIVLLILAGVTIAMLTGDNGILTKTNQAKINTEKGEVADKINLVINAELANLMAYGTLSGDAATIASNNGVTTTDFSIIPADVSTEGTVLSVSPTSDGAYGKYTSLTGTIKRDSNGKFTAQKVEIK